ncbi:MAG: site-specific integrase [Ignavibacteriales bacterium]|nr:site-specific integrase [Ignavibacteriales bacterium]
MNISIVERIRKNGNVYLFFDYYHKGKRKQESLGLSFNPKNRSERKEQLVKAEKIKRIKLNQFENDEFDFLDTSKRDLYLIPYIEPFATKKAYYYSTLLHLKNYTTKKIRFRDIDETWLRGFQDHLLNTTLHNNSASFYFSKLRELLFRASREGYIKRVIIENVRNIKRIESKREFLTIEEIDKLFKTPLKDKELKRAFLFSCNTGLRQVDVRLLKWSNIENDEIKIRQKKTKEYVFIPLSPTAKELLYNNEKTNIANEYVFSLGKDRATINRKLSRWFKSAKIEKIASYHISRHSFATMCITQGMDLYRVSKLLGHKDIKTTQIYTNLVDMKRKEAIELLPTFKINY